MFAPTHCCDSSGCGPLCRAAIEELERQARLTKKKKGKDKDRPRKEARIWERQQALLQAQGQRQGLATAVAQPAQALAPRPQTENKILSPPNEVHCAHCPLLSEHPGILFRHALVI